MLALRPLFRLTLPIRSRPPVLPIHLTLTSLARPTTYRSYSSDLHETTHSELSSSKQAIASFVTERLDKHDYHLKELDHSVRDIKASITELNLEMKGMRKDVLEGLHNLELKFQTILSQWLFGGAMLTVGVALISAGAFLFPEMKELGQAMVKERRAIAGKEQVKLEMAQFELAKKRS